MYSSVESRESLASFTEPNISQIYCVRNSNTTLRFNDLLAELTGLILPHWWLRSVAGKKIQSIISKGKGAWDKVQRKPDTVSKSPLSLKSHGTS